MGSEVSRSFLFIQPENLRAGRFAGHDDPNLARCQGDMGIVEEQGFWLGGII